MRISDLSLGDRLRANLTANTSRMAQVALQLSSGQKIDLPSDDPSGTAAALTYRATVAADTQFTRSAQAAKSRLSAADSSLGALDDLLQRARELTVQAGSGTQTQPDLSALATELNGLLQQATQVGNSNVAGVYLFGGTQTTAAPFASAGAVPGSVTYSGDQSAVNVETGAASSVRVDVPGGQVFSPAMQAIIQVRDGLQSGNVAATVQSGLTALDAALNTLHQTRADVGTRINGVDQATQTLATDSARVQGLQSQVEDTDIADASVRLARAQTVYQASLSATAKELQTSLVDFLR